MCRRHPEIVNEQGFTSGFNADLRDGDGRVWVSPGLFGLDQGIIVLMIENHRSGLPWRLMRGCRPIVDGLRRASFDRGWLDAAPGGQEARSEERRAGKAWVSTCRSWWSPEH